MKRSPELTDLSRDHHHALVLARKCVRAATAENELLAETWQSARLAFSDELEPHFRVEESLLLPALDSAGAGGLSERTLREHERLRELVELEADPDVLSEFGELLTRHVRFEEQELFPRAEQLLDPEVLAAIETASAALESAQARVRYRAQRRLRRAVESTPEAFDFTRITESLRGEAPYIRKGQTARTLVHSSDLRVVIVALKAGKTISEHHADVTASVQTLSGKLHLQLPDGIVELPAGHLLVLRAGLSHDVRAEVESTFLLTLAVQTAS